VADLDRRIAEIARTPRLLVAVDFDGTLSPIVDDPDDARPTRGSMRALSTLANQRNTRVAVISGRALSDLAARLTLDTRQVRLVGGHGSELEPELDEQLTAAQRDDLAAIRVAVDAAARGLAGITTEHKLASSALHYRRASRPDAARALCRLRRSQGDFGPDVHVRRGKKVVEVSVHQTHKGQAVDRLRAEMRATAVLFLGDDRTDEDAFRTLGDHDLGVKVGPGDTAAPARVANPDEVADLLTRLAEMRRQAPVAAE